MDHIAPATARGGSVLARYVDGVSQTAVGPDPSQPTPDPAPARPSPEPARLGAPVGRIPVTKVSPVVEGGAYPAKAAVGEAVPIRATVFREGHDAVNATVVLTGPDGVERSEPMHPSTPAGFDWWAAGVVFDTEGPWTFRVEGWSDPWETWVHTAEIKIPAGIDVDLSAPRARASPAWSSRSAARRPAAWRRRRRYALGLLASRPNANSATRPARHLDVLAGLGASGVTARIPISDLSTARRLRRPGGEGRSR